ncbi:hypothetical protein EON67_05375 [archaeon]|nr:MAG: hypothetical protein EON67_05375 [archaeon]
MDVWGAGCCARDFASLGPVPNERIRLLNLMNGHRVLESFFLEVASKQLLASQRKPHGADATSG